MATTSTNIVSDSINHCLGPVFTEITECSAKITRLMESLFEVTYHVVINWDKEGAATAPPESTFLCWVEQRQRTLLIRNQTLFKKFVGLNFLSTFYRWKLLKSLLFHTYRLKRAWLEFVSAWSLSRKMLAFEKNSWTNVTILLQCAFGWSKVCCKNDDVLLNRCIA